MLYLVRSLGTCWLALLVFAHLAFLACLPGFVWGGNLPNSNEGALCHLYLHGNALMTDKLWYHKPACHIGLLPL